MAVRGVVPIADIVPVFPADEHRIYRGTTTAVQGIPACSRASYGESQGCA